MFNLCYLNDLTIQNLQLNLEFETIQLTHEALPMWR